MSKNPILTRAFPAALEKVGPRKLIGRLVPYGMAVDVADEMPDGEFDIYREGFKCGAFSPQINTRAAQASKSIQRVGLVHRHEGGLGYLGPFVALREEPDGLYGEAMILPTKADDVEALLSAGIDQLSVEFRLPPRGEHTETINGVRWRVRAHLDSVALEPKGAYHSAQVLAFRQEADLQTKAEADKAAQEQEIKRQAEATAAAELELKAKLEADATAALERKAKFEELAARYDRDAAKQKELVRDYLPGDYRNR